MANISIYGLYTYYPAVFDDMTVPDHLDRDLVIDHIIAECFELELLYPDPIFLKNLIKVWSGSESAVWEKMYDTTVLDYNPIWNKDGKIEVIRTGSYTDNGNNTGSVKGFNSEAWADHSRSIAQNNGTSAGNETRIEQGNIGVTTTQEMIRQERDVAEFNIYAYIADSFKKRFCILIY